MSALIDQFNTLVRQCNDSGIQTYNLLVFMTTHDCDAVGDTSPPQFDPDASEDDFAHVQTSCMHIAANPCTIMITAKHHYTRGAPSHVQLEFARDGVCPCGDSYDELRDDIPGWWQTDLCEECSKHCS